MKFMERFSLSSVKSISKKTNTYYKRTFIVGAAFCSWLLSDSDTYANNSLETIYHVYIDNERIGTIQDEKLYERLVEEKIQEKQSDYDSFELVIGEKVELIPERVFEARTNTNETLQRVGEMLTVKTPAAAVYVNEEPVLHVRDEKEANKLLKEMKQQYVSEEQLNKLEAVQAANGEVREPGLGESLLLEVSFSSEVEIQEGLANPEHILSIEDALKKLNLGTLEEREYIVEQGDVLGTIADKHDLTTAELLALNPDINENTLLQIGVKINVTEYQPLTTVIAKEIALVEEKIPFSTETQEDKTMWKGDKKIVQEGKEGKRIVEYSTVLENGKMKKREATKEEIINEPVSRIVKVGTKQSTSRGTGDLAWPAVGGYISSYQGTRWGRFHKGIDIARPSNYSILAADNGTVTSAGWSGGYGNTVKINHNNGVVTLYAHLASINVKVGQTISKGQKIGVMGRTGNSTGIHLHFEVYKNGQLKNPMEYLK